MPPNKTTPPGKGEAASIQFATDAAAFSTNSRDFQRQPEQRVGKIDAPIHLLATGAAEIPAVTLEVVEGIAHVRLRNRPWGWGDCDKSFLLKGSKPGPLCRAYIDEIKERLARAANAEAERIERKKAAFLRERNGGAL